MNSSTHVNLFHQSSPDHELRSLNVALLLGALINYFHLVSPNSVYQLQLILHLATLTSVGIVANPDASDPFITTILDAIIIVNRSVTSHEYSAISPELLVHLQSLLLQIVKLGSILNSLTKYSTLLIKLTSVEQEYQIIQLLNTQYSISFINDCTYSQHLELLLQTNPQLRLIVQSLYQFKPAGTITGTSRNNSHYPRYRYSAQLPRIIEQEEVLPISLVPFNQIRSISAQSL